MQYITIIKALVALLPLIIDVVRAIEAAIPAQGQGAVKLEMAKEVLAAGYKIASDVTAQFEALWPALSAIISATVASLNKSGVFKNG